MTIADPEAAANRVLRDEEEVEARIRAICFKTGPPALIGAELEWTVHQIGAPAAPLDAGQLRRALGPHTPAALHPTDHIPSAHTADPRTTAPPGQARHDQARHDPARHDPAGSGPAGSGPAGSGPASQAQATHEAAARSQPLPAGGLVTVEPGGQLEISSAPATSLARLHRAVTADLRHLNGLLSAAGLRLGEHGIDAHRPPRRLLDTPRYAAMEHTFDARGPHGRTMMCSTAGLQVCLDAGTPAQVRLRWAAVCALGPVLMATFANSRRHAGRDTGWASARMAAWWGIDPRLSHPPDLDAGDPATGWVQYALAAPLLCLRRPGNDWDPPPGVTLRDWVNGALPHRPTLDDLDYHLSTLFPPVRPRGYLEIRYLDTQPGADWFTPVAVLTSLLTDDDTTATALDLATPTAGRWLPAARRGLADPQLRRDAGRVLDLACRRLDRTDLPIAVREQVADTAHRRLRDAGHPGE